MWYYLRVDIANNASFKAHLDVICMHYYGYESIKCQQEI